MHDPAGVAARGPLPKTIGIDQGDGMPVVEKRVGCLNADDACADNGYVHLVPESGMSMKTMRRKPALSSANAREVGARLAIDAGKSA